LFVKPVQMNLYQDNAVAEIDPPTTTEEDYEYIPDDLISAIPINRHPKIHPDDLRSRREQLFQKGSQFAPVRKSDIVGIDNVLSQIDGVITWLKHFEDFQSHAARPEPGVLFSGLPGTGKTYTSRYIATSSGARFIDVRDFPYAGMLLSATDLKELFALARKTHTETGQPVILFWDEFEAFASERSRLGQAQAALVSQITAELDGVCGKPAGILLIGCTNYAYNIDAALKRPGRMGLQVEFNAPSRKGKRVLLQHYLNKVKTTKIDLETASYFFNDTDVAATIEEAVQQAWNIAVKKWIVNGKAGQPLLAEQELLDALLNRLVGPPPAFVEITPKTRYRVAIHETGHALAAILTGVPLRLVTIRPGKKHLGKTMMFHADPMSSTIAEYLNTIQCALAGSVAERVTGIDRGMGASSDTTSASEMASFLISGEGMGERTGMFSIYVARDRSKNEVNPSISERFIEDADADAKSIIDQAEQRVVRLFEDFGPKNIIKLAKDLMEATTLTGVQFEAKVKEIHG
jgi:cell division protease FtsH